MLLLKLLDGLDGSRLSDDRRRGGSCHGRDGWRPVAGGGEDRRVLRHHRSRRRDHALDVLHGRGDLPALIHITWNQEKKDSLTFVDLRGLEQRSSSILGEVGYEG